MWKTSEATNLVFQWIFSVKNKVFHVIIVKVAVRKNLAKFLGKHMWWGPLSLKLETSKILPIFWEQLQYFFYYTWTVTLPKQ